MIVTVKLLWEAAIYLKFFITLNEIISEHNKIYIFNIKRTNMHLLCANYISILSLLYRKVMFIKVKVCCPDANCKLTVRSGFEPVTTKVQKTCPCCCDMLPSSHTKHLSVKNFKILQRDLCVLEIKFSILFQKNRWMDVPFGESPGQAESK